MSAARDPNVEVVVYRVYGRDGELLYVGQTSQLLKRLAQHSYTAKWWRLAGRFEVEPPVPRFIARDFEEQQIIRFGPRFNRVMKARWDWTTSDAQAAQTTRATPDEMKRLYEDEGWTIEQLALELGITSATARKALALAGTQMRGSGRSGKRTTGSRLKDGVSGKPDGAVHAMFAGTRGVHRRRGGKRAA